MWRSRCSCCSNSDVGAMVVVPASAQNKKKKRSKKKFHAESGHVQARYVCELSCRRYHRHSSSLQQKHSFFSLSLSLFYISSFSWSFLFIHLYAQLLTLVVYVTFDSLDIYELLFAPHLSYIWNEYAHTRMLQKKRFIMIASVQTKKRKKLTCMCTYIV